MSIKVDVEIHTRIRGTSAALLLTKFVEEQREYRWHPLKERTLDHLTQVSADSHPFADVARELADKWWMDSFYSVAVRLEHAGDRYRVPDALGLEIQELAEHSHSTSGRAGGLML